MPSGTAIERVATSDDREPGKRRAPEASSSEEGRHDHQREELGDNRSRKSRTGPAILVSSPQQECQAKKTDNDCIHVAVTREGPQGQWVPCVDEDPLTRQPGEGQQPQQANDADGLEAEDRQPHRGDAIGDPANRREHGFRQGRVDRPRVVRAIDLGVDDRITQGCQCGVCGNVPVRIDVCRLHAPVPDVAVDIRRQNRRRNQQKCA